LNIHAGGGEELALADPQQEKERAFLKRYIEYCRAMCRPHVGDRAMKMLEDSYVKYREEMRERKRTGGHAAVPITVRQLEAIVRISESLAKMCLQSTVTEEHVAEALRLFEVSTIDAARSGVADMVVLTAEQREELQVVETQIKQKLAIGATMSKRHLIDDLARIGVNEWAVTRAPPRHDATRRLRRTRRRSSRHPHALTTHNQAHIRLFVYSHRHPL
jgi:DNA replication licensing factor MCM5